MIYTHIAYLLTFSVVFGAWAASELLGPVRWSGLREGKSRDRGSILLAALLGIAGVVLSLLLPLLLPGYGIPWQPGIFFVGMALVLVGVCWRWYAIRTLGRYFTARVIIQDDQPVVQHGPYKLIRHPSYSGVLVVMGGFGLMIGNWVSLFLLTAGLFAGLLYRISVEEQELLHHFGPPYEEYMKRTKRLIPFLY
jgi:protein-S-isoprenylcysteine O-methyltransferase Ste14